MSDEDPKSLLFLCDDTIREILSYMPLKSRVRHSGTCTAVYQVVDQSLLTVKSLVNDKDWFRGEHMYSKLKTLSKLKNMETMDVTLISCGCWWQDVMAVMVANCHYVKHIKGWDIDCVAALVCGLRAKGVPDRLKTIESKIHGLDVLSLILKNTTAKFMTHDFFLDFVSLPEFVARVYGILFIFPNLPLHEFFNVRKLTFLDVRSEDDMELVLNSMPRLNDLEVSVWPPDYSEPVLSLLANATQDFRALSLYEFYPENVKLLLQKKRQNLRRLGLDLTTDSPENLVPLLLQFCPRLKYCNVHAYASGGSVFHQYKYSDKRLTVYVYPEAESLVPLLTLFPKVREIFFQELSRREVPDSWKEELRDFLARHKKYSVNAMTRVKNDCPPTREGPASH